tara:strand:+ start:80 stop:262 length:183 start_codon:yes stop_codon:yes gene_type:complete
MMQLDEVQQRVVAIQGMKKKSPLVAQQQREELWAEVLQEAAKGNLVTDRLAQEALKLVDN